MKNNNPQFNQWHGIPREQIDWHPVVDEEKCVGCGICTTTCGRGVYKFDYQKKKARVVNPSNCMVACQTCANLCPVKAISFTKKGETTRKKAQKIVSSFKLLFKGKEELEKRKEELSFSSHEK